MTVTEQIVDATSCKIASTGQHVGIDAMEDRDAVADPFGDLDGVNTGCQPGGHAGVS